jgi:hypothetical protein
MRSAGPLAKVVYDSRLHLTQQSLGTHTAVSRLQGGNLKSKREIRIASLFRDAPAAFLRMIVVHELAHLKELGHDKAFYALCTHMEPDYHQLEFDVRLWLTGVETGVLRAVRPERTTRITSSTTGSRSMASLAASIGHESTRTVPPCLDASEISSRAASARPTTSLVAGPLGATQSLSTGVRWTTSAWVATWQSPFATG